MALPIMALSRSQNGTATIAATTDGVVSAKTIPGQFIRLASIVDQNQAAHSPHRRNCHDRRRRPWQFLQSAMKPWSFPKEFALSYGHADCSFRSRVDDGNVVVRADEEHRERTIDTNRGEAARAGRGAEGPAWTAEARIAPRLAKRPAKGPAEGPAEGPAQ